ncbi:MAG TPA: DUF3823 domain-containing protein [Niabella sp.]
MKSKYSLYLITAVLSVLFSCSRNLDNYPAPDSRIYGSILNEATGEPVPSEEPNGFRIRLMAEAYGDATPIDFWGKADGSFQNTKVFTGTYRVVPIEGAFLPPDTQQVKISGSTEVNFKVTPFLSINASAKAGSKTIITEYTISRSTIADKIIVCKSLMATYPTLSNTVFDKAITHNLSAIDDNSVLSTHFKDTIPDVQSGTYYVRITAATNNALNKYNYSTVMKVEVP